ncbi:MAG: alkyl hydroperoxide reductase subunit, partial [Pseudomonadota bacterium]
MLDANIKAQLQGYLERLQRPIELVATLDTSEGAAEMRGLLEDVVTLSDKVAVRFDGTAALSPSFTVGQPGETARVSFAGVPMG